MPDRPPEEGTSMLELPMQTRSDVRLMPETVQAETRTIELVWSTGAAVRRRDPWTGKRYDEVLSLEEMHVDLSRLNGGAPLLNTHGAFDLGDVIGVVERAWIAREGDGLVGRARVRFSDRAEVEPIWRDVAAGIIRNVSVGYAVRSYEVTETDGQPPVWRAVDWQPLELSAVPVGADAAAGFRARDPATTPCRLVRHAPAIENEDTTMTTKTTERQAEPAIAEVPAAAPAAAVEDKRAAAEPAPAPAPVQARQQAAADLAAQPRPANAAELQSAAEAARAEERTRIAALQDAARKLGVEQRVVDDLVARGTGLDAARAALIDAAAARDAAQETRPHIRMGGIDAAETRRAAVEAALLHRYDPGRFALSEPAREWRGLSLIEMARAWLEVRNDLREIRSQAPPRPP